MLAQHRGWVNSFFVQNCVFGVLVNQVSGLLARASNGEIKEYSITTRQAALLGIVSRSGNKASPIQIARWLV